MPFGGPTWCMNEGMANATYRGFNYPHQAASYWAMYNTARHVSGFILHLNPQALTHATQVSCSLQILDCSTRPPPPSSQHTQLNTTRSWQWYLYRAAKTCLKLGTSSVGFMDGTVAREVLVALKVEAEAGNATFGDLAETLEANMLTRQKQWASTPFPYGSEFGFDTTGQEEVGCPSPAPPSSREPCTRAGQPAATFSFSIRRKVLDHAMLSF